MNLYAEQFKKSIIFHREIIRCYSVIIKQFLIQKVTVQSDFHLLRKSSFTFQERRNDFLGKGAHFQVNHRLFSLQGIVPVPFLYSGFVGIHICQLQLFFCGFSQNLFILVRYQVFHGNPPVITFRLTSPLCRGEERTRTIETGTGA